MIWLIIWLMAVVFAFQGFFLDPIMRPESLCGYFFWGLFYLVICGFAGVICGGIAHGSGYIFEGHAVEGQHSKLVAIRDKDGVEGQFYLGSGFISSEPYYFYYESLENGGFRPGKIDADGSVTVYEEDRKDAELVMFDWKITYPAWAWLICLRDEDGGRHSYAFHVPKGTIKTGYSM